MSLFGMETQSSPDSNKNGEPHFFSVRKPPVVRSAYVRLGESTKSYGISMAKGEVFFNVASISEWKGFELQGKRPAQTSASALTEKFSYSFHLSNPMLFLNKI